MNQAAYLGNGDVQQFLAWVEPFISGARPMRHAWHSRRWGSWSCTSVPDAWRQYDWRFAVRIPGEAQPRSGHTLRETEAPMDELGSTLRQALADGDARAFREGAVAVLTWGQVRGNEARLHGLGESVVDVFRAAIAQLDTGTADLAHLDRVRLMNSGYSKVYALLVDGFPIYDSRVACSLGSLVRLFCLAGNLAAVPPTLDFRIPAHRSRRSRDPSYGSLRFRTLRAGNARAYAASNVMAAWLLGSLAPVPPFGDLGPERGLVALQSALFMLGYSPTEAAAIT